MRRAIAVATCVLGVGLCIADAAEESLPIESFTRAQDAFLDASDGDEKSIGPARAQFESLLESAPEHPVLNAYHGAAVAMQARSTVLPWKKLRYVKEGLAEFDEVLASLKPEQDHQALRGIPATLEARLVIADTFVSIPASFQRFDRGSRLIDELLHDPAYETLPGDFRAAIWLVAAKVADRNGDTKGYRQALEQASMLDEDDRYGARARALLSERR